LWFVVISSICCHPNSLGFLIFAQYILTRRFILYYIILFYTDNSYNQAKPKTDVEARVYEVLSHKNWGASGSLMNEIARDTYDMEKYQVIAVLMWDGMENQRPAAWKIVFKSLTLLDHLVKNGAERCVDDARNHGHVLRSLGQFNYYEGTIDRGLGVREKSKQIMEILGDDDRIREERQKARKLREKFGNFSKGSSGVGSGGGGGGGGGSSAVGGYGNQDSWNNKSSGGGGGGGSGYGEGGIYENDKGMSGRYANGDSSSAPTFAAMPGEKKKSKKKKKDKKAAKQEAAPVAAEPEVDLLDFGGPPSAPAPSAAATNSSEFGAFQTTSAPAPADASGEFAAFGQMRSAQASSAPDPFAAAPVVQQQQTPTFDAFGNNGGGDTNNNMMMNNNMMNNNGAPMANANAGMAGMGNAFGNMNVGSSTPAGGMQQIQQPIMPASNDDDFGDFSDANKKDDSSFSITTKSSDPFSGMINLDSLSKNPSKKMTMNQPVDVNQAAAQYQQNIQQGVQPNSGKLASNNMFSLALMN
jgi:epsin